MFSKVYNTLRESDTLPSDHVSSERGCKQNVKKLKNIIEMAQRKLHY